jgi:H-NS histone family
MPTGENMASNLITARSLIQADLDHARSVLSLWTHQVEELERALEQIDAVSNSRNALRVQYQGTGPRAPALEAPAAPEARKKRGRKPKNADGAGPAKSASSGNGITSKRGRKLAERSTVAQVSEAKGRRSGKVSAKQGKAGRAAKYKDPNSDKTWSGLGRRPGWFVGQPEQYAINASGRGATNESQSGSAAAQAGDDASAS